MLTNIRRVFQGDGPVTVPDDALHALMQHCSDRIGDAYFRTPRNTVTAFVNLLAVIDQNPGTDWRSLVGTIEIAADAGDDMGEIADGSSPADSAAPQADDDELASFRL